VRYTVIGSGIPKWTVYSAASVDSTGLIFPCTELGVPFSPFSLWTLRQSRAYSSSNPRWMECTIASLIPTSVCRHRCASGEERGEPWSPKRGSARIFLLGRRAINLGRSIFRVIHCPPPDYPWLTSRWCIRASSCIRRGQMTMRASWVTRKIKENEKGWNEPHIRARIKIRGSDSNIEILQTFPNEYLRIVSTHFATSPMTYFTSWFQRVVP